MTYTFTAYDPERMARAARRDESISFKKSIELAKKLQGMRSDRAERYLEAVIAKKEAVPFTRFVNGAGHRRGKGITAGKYPVKAAIAFQQLLKQALANAENKGLGTPLQLLSVIAQGGSKPVRYGRQRGRQGKRTHLELVIAETEESQRREKKPKKVTKEKAPEKAPVKAPTNAVAKEASKAVVKEAPKAVVKEQPKEVAKTKQPVEKAPEKQETSKAKEQPAKEAPKQPAEKSPSPEKKSEDVKNGN